MQKLNQRQHEIKEYLKKKNIEFTQEFVSDEQCGDELHITIRNGEDYMLIRFYIDPRSDFPSEGGEVLFTFRQSLEVNGGLEDFEKMLEEFGEVL